MKTGALAALAVTILAASYTFGRPVVGRSVDWLAGRYPGSARHSGAHIDLDYLGRGWLSRQAVYATGDDQGAVERWYVQRYGPVTDADAHAGEHCAGFRTSRLIVRLVYAVSVTLCTVPSGTQITVNESMFYSPPQS